MSYLPFATPHFFVYDAIVAALTLIVLFLIRCWRKKAPDRELFSRERLPVTLPFFLAVFHLLLAIGMRINGFMFISPYEDLHLLEVLFDYFLFFSWISSLAMIVLCVVFLAKKRMRPVYGECALVLHLTFLFLPFYTFIFVIGPMV